jgi:protein-S-isoprenylcysteine O-methyltransferase Ste14
MDGRFGSELIGTAALAVAAGVALLLTLFRRPAAGDEQLRRTAVLFAAGIACQILHCSEEYATRFYERFPAVMGLKPWTSDFFLTFNVCWLIIWVWAAFGLRNRSRVAFFPVWFFAIAAALNGVAHPLLSIRVGAYFPGLITSPFLGLLGVWLLVRLKAITEPEDRDVSWRDAMLLFETIAFSVVVPGAVTWWIPRHLLGLWDSLTPASWSVWQVAALLPFGLGLAVYLKCLWEFAARGRGIPAPLDHPKQLVVTGLYRYVRNPMYLGVLLVLLGETLFLQSSGFLLYVIGWLIFVHLNVILYEEPNLTRKFGDSYKHYRSAVRRWIPGERYRPAV